uniref:Uncharacterized protein n=1 Tax=Populus trichocarpa TaxID=3694 RepID=A0A3N7EFU0_POPTR
MTPSTLLLSQHKKNSKYIYHHHLKHRINVSKPFPVRFLSSFHPNPSLT